MEPEVNNNAKHFTALWITIFAIAMGFLESAVVIYLREIYFPGGFSFPLKLIGGTIALAEILREAATMIMLLMVAFITSKRGIERFAWFIYDFAVWDIFYYVFLYLLIGWPQSLFTWDILFLIPLLWTGPVLAPVINSITMILMAIIILDSSTRTELFRIKFIEWFFIIAGSFLTIVAYTDNYIRYMTLRYQFTELFGVHHSGETLEYWSRFVPVHFSWMIFISGEVLFIAAILLIRSRRSITGQSPEKNVTRDA
jgi:hypothetical protein